MIEVIPAIDIIGGKCVRLLRGDYDEKTVYSENPVDIAKAYDEKGFRRLHIVDLDGARSSHVVNTKILEEIASRTSLEVDFGGGIKTGDDILQAFSCGAKMVTVGSIAVSDPQLFYRWLDRFGPERIILGADARNGKISVNGWNQDSSEELIPFIGRFVSRGVNNILCTDISKDGTLEGPSTDLYKEIMAKYPEINLIASGGVSSVADLKKLNECNIPSVVVGKAFYEGNIKIDELSKQMEEWH